MKKITSILLLIVYMTTAVGFGVDRHFCGGELVSAKLYGFGKAGCGCAQEEKCECCKDETIVYKSNEHQVQNTSIPLPKASDDIYGSNFPVITLNLVRSKSIQKSDFYDYVQTTSSREILSLIHVLRI